MIPSSAWMLTMANAPVSKERVMGGRAARTTGFRAVHHSAVVPMYEA